MQQVIGHGHLLYVRKQDMCVHVLQYAIYMCDTHPAQCALCNVWLKSKGGTVASRAPSMLFWIRGLSSDDAIGRLSSATGGAGLDL